MFETHGIKYNAMTYQHLLESCARRDNIERALELVNEMDKVGIIPNADCVQIVIMLAARLGMSQLAMEMATKSIGVPEVVDEKVRMSILMSAAANLHVSSWAQSRCFNTTSFLVGRGGPMGLEARPRN